MKNTVLIAIVLALVALIVVMNFKPTLAKKESCCNGVY